MNKKNISLILIGILLLVLQFYVRVGNATIDVFSDVIGFILIVIGILPLAPRNVLFKKARLAAILGTAAAVIGQALLFKDWGDSASQMRTMAAGLSTIFTIVIFSWSKFIFTLPSISSIISKSSSYRFSVIFAFLFFKIISAETLFPYVSLNFCFSPSKII